MTAFKSFAVLFPVCLVASGCIIVDDDDDLHCDGTLCCDEYGCYPQDDDDGVPNPTTGGFAQGGSAQGGASEGGGGAAEGGAPATCDPTLVVCSCSSADECGEGQTCLDGQCLSPCEFDYQCGDRVCAEGSCVAACDAEVPCGAGYACVGGGCMPDPFTPECADSSTCEGLECVEGFCTTLCQANADCPEGELCDEASGSCFPDPTPETVCSEQVPCSGEGQTCVDGFCHYACDDVLQCKLIDNRFEGCDEGYCKTETELDPTCTYEIQCDPGAVCVSNECVGTE